MEGARHRCNAGSKGVSAISFIPPAALAFISALPRRQGRVGEVSEGSWQEVEGSKISRKEEITKVDCK